VERTRVAVYLLRLNSLESLFDKEGLREFGIKGVDPERCEDGAAECCQGFGASKGEHEVRPYLGYVGVLFRCSGTLPGV